MCSFAIFKECQKNGLEEVLNGSNASEIYSLSYLISTNGKSADRQLVGMGTHQR